MSTFDPASLETRLGELEAELNTPGFWDDQNRAAKVSAEHARVSRRLEGYRRLRQEYDDAREFAAMDGGEMESELKRRNTVERDGRSRGGDA